MIPFPRRPGDALGEGEDPTLHLPRVLALHGGGTNARIFKAQCRVLERALKLTCRLCFADAPFPSQPGPDVTSVYGDYGPFRAWLRWQPDDPERDPETAVGEIQAALLRAMAEDDAKGATGAWIGLLGFSQGAKICASLLFAQQSQGPKSIIGPTFRFAVLMAGKGPLVALRLVPDEAEAAAIMVPGMVDAATSTSATTTCPAEHSSLTREQLLRVPTVHVHGVKDPGLELHRKMLHQYCDTRYTRVVEWGGAHRVPIRTEDVARVVDAIASAAKAPVRLHV